MASLYQLTGEYLALQTALEGDEIGDDALAVEALARIGEAEDALERKQLGCAMVVRSLDMDAEAVDSELARLTARKKNLAAKREWLVGQMIASMQLAGVERVKGPTLTVAIQLNPPSVVIEDESAIPREYMVTPEPPPPPKPRPDKKAILDAHKKLGELVPGTRVERGVRLTIK